MAWRGRREPHLRVGFYPYGVAINFEFLVDRRSDAQMARLAKLARAIPGAARHYERLEEVGYKMRPTLVPDEVLADDVSLEAFKQVIADGTQPPAS